MHDDLPAFSYVIEALPPGRIGRRWRYRLYRGERLLAAGWRLGERSALVALRTAASRATHELAGLIALRPERTTTDRPFLAGATVEVDCGALRCTLTPRAEPPAPRRRASAA